MGTKVWKSLKLWVQAMPKEGMGFVSNEKPLTTLPTNRGRSPLIPIVPYNHDLIEGQRKERRDLMAFTHKTARYKVIADSGGNRYSFFCDITGALLHTTDPIQAETQEQELETAWEDARKYFNRCHKCGKWVSNAMYNADVAECVECAPWEDPPRYCSHCGKEITSAEIFCPRCGKRLQYGGEGL